MSGRRLYRSTTDRKIGGVCGGIAAYLNMDPVIVRLIAVGMLLLPGPPTLLFYLIACFVIPNQPSAASASPDPPQAEYIPPGGTPGGTPSGSEAPPAPSQESAGGPAAEAPARQADPYRGSLISGLIIFWVGVLFLCLNFGVFDWRIFHWWRWRNVWPMILIGLGGWMLWRSWSADRESAGRQGT